MSSSPQQQIAYRVLVNFNVLVEPIDLVVISKYFVLNLRFNCILGHPLYLRTVLLDICLCFLDVMAGEGRELIDCFNEVDCEELVVDGGESVLVAF